MQTTMGILQTYTQSIKQIFLRAFSLYIQVVFYREAEDYQLEAIVRFCVENAPLYTANHYENLLCIVRVITFFENLGYLNFRHASDFVPPTKNWQLQIFSIIPCFSIIACCCWLIKTSRFQPSFFGIRSSYYDLFNKMFLAKGAVVFADEWCIQCKFVWHVKQINHF